MFQIHGFRSWAQCVSHKIAVILMYKCVLVVWPKWEKQDYYLMLLIKLLKP